MPRKVIYLPPNKEVDREARARYLEAVKESAESAMAKGDMSMARLILIRGRQYTKDDE